MRDRHKMPALYILLTSLSIGLVICVSIPPKITKQSSRDIFYKKGESIKMECEASGEPNPSYSWKRAETTFAPEGNDDRIVKQKGRGTLIINSPEDKDEGLYQCFATNSQGTASTVKYNLKMAKLDEFNSNDPIIHTPLLGAPLTLSCQSPDSVPDAQIYWAFGDGGDMQPVFWDSRITMDYEDRLYFTYVIPEDSKDGKAYHCVVYNSYMRMSVIGPPQFIKPVGTNLVLSEMRKLWPTSRFDLQGLVGSDFKMKCIFSGNPSPMVKWKRKDYQPFNSRVLQGNSGGQELIIRDLQFDDAGTYLCDGSRDQESTPLEMSVNLNVHSRPVWTATPKDVIIGENGTAEFECAADGVPRPQIFWFVNGEPLESALRSDRRLDQRFQHLRAELIILQNVTKMDTMVFQCNITNIHGYLWAEAFLNVLSEAPTILEHPQDTKVAEGQPFVMSCHITGKPEPIITWYKNGQQVTGGRYQISETGNLVVQSAVLSDAGEFKCEASNSYGKEGSFANLIVRRKTVIQWKPMDLEVQRGTNAKFTCSGTTDPEEITQLTTTWLKDGEPVDLGTRMFLNIQDLSLTISGTEQRDTGTFMCVVSNGLDNDTVSARLVVTDIPDAPYNLKIKEECLKGGTAELEWIAGSFNNAPIEYFLIEYMTKVDPDRWVFAKQVDYRQDSYSVPLAAGMDYSFRVTAYNKIGASVPSVPSNTSCVTTPSTPSQNPRNVRTIGDMKGMLHIEWTPVPPENQGGKNFTYIISLQKYGDPQSNIYTKKILDWRISQYIYPTTGDYYTRYKITVKSRNVVGDSAEAAQAVNGYSSEEAPTIWPTDLNVQNIQSDTALFTWQFDRSEIGKVNNRIQGEFRGFKIQFWEQSRQAETIREYDVSPEIALTNASANTFSATVHHLIPNTRMQARVALLNNFYVSKPSDVIAFVTPPGLPGPVELLEDLNIGDNHINLQWRSPLDNRGDILGYDIGYQEVRDLQLEEMQERLSQIDDPYATNAMLSGLLPNTRYRIYVWARTAAGRGEGFFIERTTASPGIPMIPRFTIAKVGTDFINVTWWRDAYQRSGSVVYVEYKKQDGPEWISTTPDVSRDWASVGFLQPGIKYNIRIAVTNGETTRLSQEEDVTTDGAAKAYDVVANLGWFLGMLLSLILEISLVILFVICYRRGFRFSGKDQEIRTYRNGSDTYTDKEEIPRVSKDFGPEPGGYSNDIYRDNYDGEDDVDNTGRFQKYDNRYNDEYNNQEYQNPEYDDQEYQDPEYNDKYHDYGHTRNQRHVRSDDNEGGFVTGRTGSEYEEYSVHGSRDTSFNKSNHSDTENYPPPPFNNYSSEIEEKGRSRDDISYDASMKKSRREVRSKDHTGSVDSSHAQGEGRRRQTDRSKVFAEHPADRGKSHRSAEEEPHREQRHRQDSRNDRDRQHRQDDHDRDRHHRQDDHDRDRNHRLDDHDHDSHYRQDDHNDHDHRSRRRNGNHDHDKCEDVVDEFRRYSAAGPNQGSSPDNGHGHSSTFV